MSKGAVLMEVLDKLTILNLKMGAGTQLETHAIRYFFLLLPKHTLRPYKMLFDKQFDSEQHWTKADKFYN